MRVLKYILRLMAAAAVALLVWEVILENCVIREPGGNNSPILGRIFKPGIYLQGTEGYCKTRMNSLGMRGADILPKTAAEYRILMLGDSQTAALQVSDDKTFVHLLQTKLARNTGREIRTINAGRNGASPAYYIHLSNFYHSFMDPDYVIIEINEDFITPIVDKTREFYVKKEGAEYVTVANFRDYYLWRMFPPLKVIKPFVAFSTFKIALDEIPVRWEQHRNHGAPARQEGTPAVDYADVIDWTLKTLKSAYPEMAILYLTLNKTESDMEALWRGSANKYGIDLVNTRDAFSGYYQFHLQPVNGFYNTMPGTGHINEIGHAILADCLADYFMRKVLR
ncbi:MAG: hypothetical protein WB930_01570 [Syntrophobacteraceae bacterium]